jgi:cobalt-zinc-cadmium resistance protein CzcA
MLVRLAPRQRNDLETIRNITVGAQNPNGSGVVQIPLSEVASINLTSGPSFIYREQQERYLPIKFSVRGRDLGSAVLEVQRKIAQEVQLPAGYRLEWVGELGNLQDAIDRLKLIVPLSLALIALLLYVYFSSIIDMFLALSVIPMAMIGGIFALFVTGTPFSVSAAIGFIALFGISVMDSIIVLRQFNQLIRVGFDRTTAILRACELQMRPVAMTCVIACVGLLPAALSTGIGSQVQKPLAVVVVGGMILAPILILIILPVLILLFSQRKPHAAAISDTAVRAPAE